MDIEIREYRESDYSRCAALVGEAWQFDSVFKPAEFTELAKDLYTGGSLIESSFKSVAVSNGEVVGFLFGIHRVAPGTGLHLLFRLKMVWRFYRIRNASPNKNDLIKALSAHEKNRSPWVPRKRNEIALFVVANPLRAAGWARRCGGHFSQPVPEPVRLRFSSRQTRPGRAASTNNWVSRI